jgi:hypothetical protein
MFVAGDSRSNDHIGCAYMRLLVSLLTGRTTPKKMPSVRSSTTGAVVLLALMLGAVAQTVTFHGYLADVLCVQIVTALDGANMRNAPYHHSIHCLRDIPRCVTSGYEVLVDANTTGSWSEPATAPYKNVAVSKDTPVSTRTFVTGVKLLNSGDCKARTLAYMAPLSEHQNNILVTVTGTMVTNNGEQFLDCQSVVSMVGHTPNAAAMQSISIAVWAVAVSLLMLVAA